MGAHPGLSAKTMHNLEQEKQVIRGVPKFTSRDYACFFFAGEPFSFRTFNQLED
jgi:hypothetical protein